MRGSESFSRDHATSRNTLAKSCSGCRRDVSASAVASNSLAAHVSERGERLGDVLVDGHSSMPSRRLRFAGDSSACASKAMTSRSSRASFPFAYAGEASMPSARAIASAPKTRSEPLIRRSARKALTANVIPSWLFSSATEGGIGLGGLFQVPHRPARARVFGSGAQQAQGQ
jgi:hypothetical protein